MGLRKKVTGQPEPAKDFAARAPSSITLAFSLLSEPPLTSHAQAPGGARPGPALAESPAIVKFGPKYKHKSTYWVDLSQVPLVVLTRLLLLKGDRLTGAYLGWLTPSLHEDGGITMVAGIDRYNRAGGKFLTLVEGCCAVNLAQVTSVKAVSLGRRVKIKFPGGEATWTPPQRAQVRQAVERFARAQANMPAPAPVSPAGLQKP